ncbi:hypothetical protein C8A00DRAFT_31031 [Chaetomidium leptoderma]|uniref:Uncharacterized protein n=1 Tax=Chaetomidium leptoderma TaxID=669021 RepID=A0AAN6VRL4_9PEZI|nr:hypothetical protein C8A00DRAFT_31031 [Chaetomidium leptoderma]
MATKQDKDKASAELIPRSPPPQGPPPFEPPPPFTPNPYTDTDRPPAYQSLTEGAGPDPDEMLEPEVFVIHGRFVYPQGAAGGEASSEPTYQLSRAIHLQGQATETIAFQRLDLRVRTASDGSPGISKRAKDVYELEHRKELPHAGIAFQAWMAPQSRKTLGRVEIEHAPLLHSGYRALKVLSDAEKRWLEKQGTKVKKGDYHFAMKEQRDNTWRWIDAAGKHVATQVRESPAAEDGEAEHRLNVLVPLPRRTRDTLVALWCLWMWHNHVEDTKPKRTWEDRKRIMQMPRTYVPN